MSSTNDATAPSLNLQAILSAALANYSKQTGKDLENDPLAAEIRQCESPDHILSIFEKQAQKFDEFRNGDSKLMKYLKPIVDGLHALSTNAALSAGVSLAFPPAQIIFSGISVLLTAAKGIKDGYDALVDVFECIENFLLRLMTYIRPEIKPTLAVTEILSKIMTEFLSVLALATKWMNEGRLKKFAKKLFGDDNVQAVLGRLDRLTQEESRATAVQTLEVIYGLVNNMTVVMEDGKASTEGIRQALVLIQQAAEKINKTNRDQSQENFRRWLSPPDPSTNHNITCKAHHDGTSSWFIQGDTFKKWKTTGSLLWIRGNPGSGKSVLCSTVIQDIQHLREAGLATFAYFYFDFRDSSKRDARSLLSSLLVQLCAQSDPFCEVLSALYSTHDRGSRQPGDDALKQCLKKMLEIPGQGPVYLIIDALDECPNSSGFPTSREQVLEVVQDLVDFHLPHLHLCIASRPEVDIRATLESLAIHSVSLHEQVGQNQDIINYINSVVRSDPKMRRWREEDKKLVIDTLSRKAGGMFRWVHCQIETLRRCFPQSIKRALDELPQTLDDTYERTLQDIDEEKRGYAHRLFQCLTVSIRPLRAEELAEILAIQLGSDAETTPGFNADWRPEDAEEAVLSACSTLVAVVDVDGSKVVQFSHFTVKEYLTSSRLAYSHQVSYYHVPLLTAHTFLARACLCILLQLDDRIDGTGIEDFPLATYAAEHWVDHAQFEGVSSLIRDGMNRLFDRDKQHFAAWIWLHDIDRHSSQSRMYSAYPGPRVAHPLYYAALCGFRDLVARLVGTHPQDIHARGGDRATPLHASLDKGHHDIALSLLEQGANVNARDMRGATPLHLASRHGDTKVVRSLIDRGADPSAENKEKETPLFMALANGKLQAARVLLEYGANANHRDEKGSCPLHRVSSKGHYDIAQLLLNHGANGNEQDADGWTPLHLALKGGHVAIARVLLEHGANVGLRNKEDWTPLHFASQDGHVDVVQLLLERGADPNAENKEKETPLSMASKNGRLEAARLLLEHGADVNHREEEWAMSSLEWVSMNGHYDIAHLLLAHGTKANEQDMDGVAPLHLASKRGHAEVARLLLSSGADVNVQMADLYTPLHSAAYRGRLRVAEVLLEHGADLHILNKEGKTPFQVASERGHYEIAQFLLERAREGTWGVANTGLHRRM